MGLGGAVCEAGARRAGQRRGRGPAARTEVGVRGVPQPQWGWFLTFRMRRLMMDSAAKTRSPTADSSILLLPLSGGDGAHSP